MINLALICGASYNMDLNDWHHYGFWKKTLDEMPNVKTTWYALHNWKEMPKDFDLYFFLDFNPELYKLSKFDYYPRVLFWWDSFHVMFSVLSQLALVFDKVYLAEMVDAQHLRGIGFSNVEWLPGAFYPGLYNPLTNNKKFHNFSFIGQLDDVVIRKGVTRKEIIANLANQFGGYIGSNVRGPHVNQVYNDSKILVERTIYCNIGTRLFELVGSGGFCLINRYPCDNGLDKLGIDGIHFVTYDDSLEDLLYKMNYYLKNEEEREKISKTGYTHFLENHTYKKRILKIFRDFKLS